MLGEEIVSPKHGLPHTLVAYSWQLKKGLDALTGFSTLMAALVLPI